MDRGVHVRLHHEVHGEELLQRFPSLSQPRSRNVRSALVGCEISDICNNGGTCLPMVSSASLSCSEIEEALSGPPGRVKVQLSLHARMDGADMQQESVCSLVFDFQMEKSSPRRGASECSLQASTTAPLPRAPPRTSSPSAPTAISRTTARAQLTTRERTANCVSHHSFHTIENELCTVKTVDEILKKFNRPELVDVLEQVSHERILILLEEL